MVDLRLVVQMLTLVANSFGTVWTTVFPFAIFLTLPRLGPIARPREFATSVNVGFAPSR
jgi:hypothetical protein